MKNKINILLAIFTLFAIAIKCEAQFTNAIVGETGIGTPVFTTHTGCDVAYDGSIDLTVSVWDDSNGRPGISYDDNSGNSGALGLQKSDAYDPDVAIIKNGSDMFALVVYHSASTGGTGGSFMAEFYTWNGAFALTTGMGSNPINLSSGHSFQSTINVDGNLLGDFAIVWDQDSLGWPIPKCITGTIVSTLPVLNFTTPISLIPGTATFKIKGPDVTLYDSLEAGQSYYSTQIMYASYYDNSNGNMIIQEERWPNINSASPFINYTQFANFVPNAAPSSYPRIAVAKSNASRYHLALVYDYPSGA
jgi:hypothetical protein